MEKIFDFGDILPPISSDDKLVAQVYCTTHYEKFKFIGQNRKTDHVKALVKSLSERCVPNAILCNEKYEIIDGQNRFLALKELGMPILYFCIRNLDIYDVAFLNSYAKNWSNKDFVDMWAALGKEEYKVIQEFSDEFKELGLSNCLMILSLAVSGQKGSIGTDENFFKNGHMNATNHLKRGTFKIVDIQKSRFIANSIMQYKAFANVGVPIYRQTPFVSAMMRLLRDDKFDNNEMVKKVTLYPQLFYRCVNGEGYITMLEKLYNYRRKGQRYRLVY